MRRKARPRICREARAQLPELVEGTLPWWRRRLVRVHLRRCGECWAELVRQRLVNEGLDGLGDAAEAAAEPPPEDLLGALLEEAGHSGVRGRAAVPARGAVSGARPALSAGLLLLGAAAGTAAGYATWRVLRVLRTRPRRR